MGAENMLFISAEDFFCKVKDISPLTREEEKALGIVKDAAAREKLLQGYLPTVAAFVKRAPKEIQTLSTVYECISALEKAIDSFDFSQDNVRFAPRLCTRLRQCIVKCIANR